MRALLASRRLPFACLALACAGLLGVGYFLQYRAGLTPCPLCILQRLSFAAVGSLAALAALLGPGRAAGATLAALILAASGAGAGIAGRQVWLQHLPADRIPECGPGLDFILDAYPLGEALRTVLRGSGDCAKVDWTLLGLSIAEWSLLCFSGFMLTALALLSVRLRAPRAAL